jgi:hypothetical protein
VALEKEYLCTDDVDDDTANDEDDDEGDDKTAGDDDNNDDNDSDTNPAPDTRAKNSHRETSKAPKRRTF